MSTLRGRLLVIIGGSLLLIWTIVAVWMLSGLRRELHATLDERLAASARMVAGLASQFPPSDTSTLSPSAALVELVARDGLACEVSLVRGELSVRPVARIGASPPMQEGAPGFSTRVYGGKLWRTFVLQQGGIRVATADRLDLREALLRDVTVAAAAPFGIALLGSLLLLWVGVGRGLAPLERMRMRLATRRADDDVPLPASRIPGELQPLVQTIAQLLERVRNAMTRERRFTDDAAHELRTPLTGVKTHLQVLRLALGGRAVQSEDVRQALDHADAGVKRLERTLQQLLTLARIEGDAQESLVAGGNLEQAALQAAREATLARPQAAQVRVHIESGCPDVRIPEPLLVSALRNLLDNALNAAPAESTVQLNATSHAGLVRLCVLDEGPGMTEAQCMLATRRFWRASKSESGSGLGLSITASIAERYSGSHRQSPRSPRGLRAELEIPAQQSA